jgi:acetyl esterase/lipase
MHSNDDAFFVVGEFGHREKFGNTPEKHRDFSAVTHVAKGKNIPPFMIMHVADHPDTSAQALRLANSLRAAGISATLYGAKESTHSKINEQIGLADDPGTIQLFKFIQSTLAK